VSAARGRALGIVLMLLGAGAFSALGWWQWQRAHWKERLLLDYAETVQGTATDLAAALHAGPRLPLRADLAASDAPVASGFSLPLRVRAQGRYISGDEVLLDNQVLDGRVGIMVYTRFQVEGAKRTVLVNRGWLPLDAQRHVPPVTAAPSVAVELSGLLMPPPSSGWRLANPEFVRGAPAALFTRLDMDALRAQMDPDLFDGVIWLDADQAHGFTRQWRALPNTLPPERHRGYAVQWFGLALASIVIGVVMLWRKPR
jgi:cytochrome oxidase assembly protein ShyY1